jgi:hypothetical protein
LGMPSEPGRVIYRGTSVDVKQKDIIAARGNPAAVFTATQLRPHTGSPYYVLGKVEFATVPHDQLKEPETAGSW